MASCVAVATRSAPSSRRGFTCPSGGSKVISPFSHRWVCDPKTALKSRGIGAGLSSPAASAWPAT
eukprot:2848300-Pyramimonas_sp.AAC.1